MRSIIRSPILATTMLYWASARIAFGQDEPPPPMQEDTVRLVAQLGHTSTINSVAISPDGRQVLTASSDQTAALWDVATGKELRHFAGHPSPVVAVAFTPDGKRLLTASRIEVRLYDAVTGKYLRQFRNPGPVGTGAYKFTTITPDGRWIYMLFAQGNSTKMWKWEAIESSKPEEPKFPHAAVRSLAVAPNGQHYVVGVVDKKIRMSDLKTGAELRQFKTTDSTALAIVFSRDGKRLLTADSDKFARLWDVSNGKELKRFEGSTGSIAFSPDSKKLLTGGDKIAWLWDTATGKELLRFEGLSNAVTAAAFSRDGSKVALSLRDGTSSLWDTATGKEVQRFVGLAAAVESLAISSDGRQVLASGADKTVNLWDLTGNQGPRGLNGHAEVVDTVALSGDGRRALTAGRDGTARVWDTNLAKELLSVKVERGRSVAFSPNGQQFLTGGTDKIARLWDTASGEEKMQFVGHADPVGSVAFSANGQQVVTGSFDQTWRNWNAVTGKSLRQSEGKPETSRSTVVISPNGHFALMSRVRSLILFDLSPKLRQANFDAGRDFNFVRAAAFSPDGKKFITTGYDASLRMWDTTTHKEITKFQHWGAAGAAAFFPDSKWVMTGGSDGTLRVRDAATAKQLFYAISFRDGSWAVVDPVGRFDASNGGDVLGLHWILNDIPVSLRQLKDRYYDPGLLAKYLGFNKEPLRNVKEFRDVKLYPEVAVAQADPKKAAFDVKLTNQEGGFGRVVVLVNGKEMTADARPADAKKDAATLDVKVDLTNDPRIVPGQKNKVEVVAYNAEGTLTSRGMVREFDGPGEMPKDPPKPTIHAVIVGVSKYTGEKLNLRYAAKDAEDFATAMRIASGRLFPDKSNITVLTTAEGSQMPTRTNILAALEKLKSTKPGDTILVYLAGHGITYGGQDGDWYYLTSDAPSADLKDDKVRQQVTLSSAELTEILKSTPAQKQVLILDTCHSGLVVEKIAERRDVPGAQVRAVERVKDRTGMHVLAGCAADSVSYEASRYGQGLLTYSLLMGMRGAKLRQGEFVDIVDLFGYAADKVPELARDIGGVQKPTIASPRGDHFDIGQLKAEDLSKIPLQTVKPVLLRSAFQEDKRTRDGLGLGKRVNDLLRQASAVPRGAKLVYVEADEFPGALQAGGRYTQDGDKITVSVTLFNGDKELAAFKVEGSASKLDDLAASLASGIQERLGATMGK